MYIEGFNIPASNVDVQPETWTNISTFKELSDDTKRQVSEEALNRWCSSPVEVDGKLFRCGSRSRSKCASCSRFVTSEWKQLFFDGYAKENSTEFSYLFLTLTAPSFGATHKVPRYNQDYVAQCECSALHKDTETHLRGVPVNFDEYDYETQAAWNAYGIQKLWHATNEMLRRHFKDSVKVEIADENGVIQEYGYEYALAKEQQKRLALHIHVLVRVPRYAIPEGTKQTKFIKELRKKLRSISVDVPVSFYQQKTNDFKECNYSFS